MEDLPEGREVEVTEVEAPLMLLQCRTCRSYLMSEEKFRVHFENCGSLMEATENTEEEDRGSSIEEEMKPFVFPNAMVVLKRLSSVEIEDFRLEKDSKQQGKQLVVDVGYHHQAPASRKPAWEAEFGRQPRRSSLAAMKNIRDMNNRRVLVEDKNDHEDDRIYNPHVPDQNDVIDEDEEDTSDSSLEPPTKRRRPMRNQQKSPRPPKNSEKAENGSKVRKTADDWYSFHCSKCTAYYYNQESLDQHIITVHREDNQSNVFTCPICSRMLLTRLSFQSHLKRHSNAEEVECTFNLWNGWPKSTSKIKKTMNFTCKYCLLPHTSHYSFLTHMKAKHGDKGQFYTWPCGYCSVRTGFESVKLLITHIRNSHQQEYYGQTLKYTLGLGQNPRDETRARVKCDICGKPLDIYHLKSHKRKMHGIFEKVKDLENPYNDTVTSIKKNCDSNMFECPMKNCHARLKTAPFLKRHFILHLQNNPYVCKVPGCWVRCDAQSHLNRHMKHHTGELTVNCPKCGLSLSRKDKLLTHKCGNYIAAAKRQKGACYQSRHVRLRLDRIVAVKQEVAIDLNDDDVDTESSLPPPMEISHGAKIEGNIDRKPNSRSNINAIFLTDPVFLKVCEENPGFKELIMGPERITNKNIKRIRQRSTGKKARKQAKRKKMCLNQEDESEEEIQQDEDEIPPTSPAATLVKVEPELIINADDLCDNPKVVKIEPSLLDLVSETVQCRIDKEEPYEEEEMMENFEEDGNNDMTI